VFLDSSEDVDALFVLCPCFVSIPSWQAGVELLLLNIKGSSSFMFSPRRISKILLLYFMLAFVLAANFLSPGFHYSPCGGSGALYQRNSLAENV
jgi:hypothetical protein